RVHPPRPPADRRRPGRHSRATRRLHPHRPLRMGHRSHPRSPRGVRTRGGRRMTSRPALWKYAAGLAPVVLVWAVLVVWLAGLLVDRANWSERSDQSAVREWLDETRPYRKSLPELAREYVQLVEGSADGTRRQSKAVELEEHIQSLAEPTRVYSNLL